MKRLLLILLALLLFGCAAKNAPAAPAETEPAATAAPEAVPSDAPAAERAFHFKTTDLDGNTFSEASFDGYDLVMVNFWAYWCPPCRAEMPDLEQLHQAYPNVLLLGVIVDDSDMDETRAVIESTGVTYPVLYPKGDLLRLAAACQYIPTTYFISPDGAILGDPVVGAQDLDGWTATVEALLP